MSPYFTRHVEPGSMVFLGDVEGEFRLPDPLPERTLLISAGSGITPIWACCASSSAATRSTT